MDRSPQQEATQRLVIAALVAALVDLKRRQVRALNPRWDTDFQMRTVYRTSHRTGEPPPGAAVAPSGFSLAEMLFVVVIIGILASMVTPLFAPGRWRADSAVQELAMSLNAAQRLAVLRQHDVVVTFDVAGGVIRIHRDVNNDGIRDTGEDFRVQELPETMGFGGDGAPSLAQGTGPVSFAAGGTDPTLTFHRNGSASASGVIYVRPLLGSLSLDPEAVRALTVERATGEVRCYSYRTGSWEPSC